MQDLREFVCTLRAHGMVHDIHVEVDAVDELGTVLKACEEAGRAAFFHRVRGHDTPVFGGALGSHERVALALEIDDDDVFERVRTARSAPIPPRLLSGQAACHEIAIKDDVDVTQFPVPKHAPDDGGVFINAGVVIARDPESRRHNLTFTRMQVFEPNVTGMNINMWRHLREFVGRARERDERLPVCVAIGVDPALLMAAAFRYDGDEYEIAGALRGEPVPVVRAMTCDVLVPAFAEIVLEGEVWPDEERMEGPMAEFTGHYSGVRPQNVFHVRAITHRKDPIFQTIGGASYEHLILGNALTREPVLDSIVRSVSPRIGKVYLPPEAAGFTAIISLRNPSPGEARTVALAALHSHVNVKTVILVDDDVDVRSRADVLWALSTRTYWDRDCIVLPGLQGNDLDPSSDSDGVQAKAIIDCTLGKERADRYKRVRYPRINLDPYLGGREA